MNIVSKLTLRHMRLGKRRTLVTVIGVIISVAMITAVATIVASFLDLLQRQTIAGGGEWHVLYQDADREQVAAIREDEASRAVVVSRELGYARLEGSRNRNKPYLFITSYNREGFAHFPIELIEGRLPQAAGELVISEEMAATAQVALRPGDTWTGGVGGRYGMEGATAGVQLGQNDGLMHRKGELLEEIRADGEKTFTIVGIVKRPTWEPTWSPGYTAISYIDEHLLEPGERADAAVLLDKVTRDLYAHAEQLAQRIGLEGPIRYNSELLRYYGVTNRDVLNRVMLSLTVILMAIIMIGSVSLIYNAFAISVSERSRHLGMLSSVGATRRQKRNSVFFEGLIIGLFSIPLGFACGLAGIGVTFVFVNEAIRDMFNTNERLTVVVTPSSLILACAVSILTIFISTYGPARRASRVSAMDAIRQTQDIRLTGKAVRTSKLVRKLFGFEAEIGLKNLKRNRRRYQATVFSLVISIVLFLTVSYFTSSLKKPMEMSQTGIDYDIEVAAADGELDDAVIRAITGLEDVTAHSAMKRAALLVWVDEEAAAEPLRERAKTSPDMLKDGRIRYYAYVQSLDGQSLKAYAERTGASYEELADPDGMRAIVVDTAKYQDAALGKYVETKAIRAKIGDAFRLLAEDGETGAETALGEVRAARLTDELPMGVFPAGAGGLNLVVSEAVLARLLEGDAGGHALVQDRLVLKSNDPMDTQRRIEEIGGYDYSVRNLFSSRQQEERTLMTMSVFAYGFILLITAIAIANIFNTISVGIALRKREFAMLKSVGMTPEGFGKMLRYESIFYGIKSLLYGLPVSAATMLLIHRSMDDAFDYPFAPPWLSILLVLVAVFVIVGSSMAYSGRKVKRDNIIDAIRQESI